MTALLPEERERRARTREENARRRAEMPPCPCINWSAACALRTGDWNLWLSQTQTRKLPPEVRARCRRLRRLKDAKAGGG